MIFVAQQTVLTGPAAGVAGLAQLFFHGPEVGDEFFRIALLVALQIGAAFFKVMAGQATAILQHAEMRLMDEIREPPQLCLDLGWGEIDEPSLAPDTVDAMAFRA